jgi:hypothetical protein
LSKSLLIHRIIKSVSIIPNQWVEGGKNYSEKSMIAQATIKIIKILLELMAITYMKNFYQQMHLISKSILLGLITCTLKREGLRLLMEWYKETLRANN